MGRVIDEGRNAVRGLRSPSSAPDDLEQAFAGIQQEARRSSTADLPRDRRGPAATAEADDPRRGLSHRPRRRWSTPSGIRARRTSSSSSNTAPRSCACWCATTAAASTRRSCAAGQRRALGPHRHARARRTHRRDASRCGAAPAPAPKWSCWCRAGRVRAAAVGRLPAGRRGGQRSREVDAPQRNGEPAMTRPAQDPRPQRRRSSAAARGHRRVINSQPTW